MLALSALAIKIADNGFGSTFVSSIQQLEV